jgi:hypothetical protein
LYAAQWTLWITPEVNRVRREGTPTHPKKEPKERGRRRILHQKIFSKNIVEFTQKIFSLKIAEFTTWDYHQNVVSAVNLKRTI